MAGTCAKHPGGVRDLVLAIQPVLLIRRADNLLTFQRRVGGLAVFGVQPHGAGTDQHIGREVATGAEFHALVACLAILAEDIAGVGVGQRAFQAKERCTGRPALAVHLHADFVLFAGHRLEYLACVGGGIRGDGALFEGFDIADVD